MTSQGASVCRDAVYAAPPAAHRTRRSAPIGDPSGEPQFEPLPPRISRRHTVERTPEARLDGLRGPPPSDRTRHPVGGTVLALPSILLTATLTVAWTWLRSG
jgi:hypothetical protein